MPPADAAAVARASGRATADYIVANRIPRTVRNVLAWLPRWMAARVLLASIRRHSWTFAGSGRVTATTGRQLALTIAVNPIARPGCHWHVAVFERLFKVLISPDARVTHPCCCARGDTACRFEIDI